MTKKRNWVYIIVMPIVIVTIFEFIPTEHLNTLPRILLGGLIGFLVSMILEFFFKEKEGDQ